MQEIDVIINGAREYNYPAKEEFQENTYGTIVYYYFANMEKEGLVGKLTKKFDFKRKNIKEDLVSKGLSYDNEIKAKLILSYDYVTESTIIADLVY